MSIIRLIKRRNIMSWAINGLLKGEFLELPYVAPAASVGTISLVLAIGLSVLGFPCSENVVTAMFTIAAVGGLAVTAIGAIAYSIFATGMQQGNERAMRRDWGY